MRWFTNLKTRSKLTAGFGLVILLLLVIIITARISIQTVRVAESGIAAAILLENNFNAQQSALLSAALVPPGTEMEANVQEVDVYSSDTSAVLKRLDSLYYRDDELQSSLERITAIREEYVRTREAEVIPFIRQQKKEAAVALILGVQAERFTKMRGFAKEFSQRLTERSQATLDQAQLVFAIFGAVALLVAGVMIFGMGRLIANPLEKITVAADRIADGDLSVEFSGEDRSDEVGALTQTEVDPVLRPGLREVKLWDHGVGR